jgi:hypothetical protein
LEVCLHYLKFLSAIGYSAGKKTNPVLQVQGTQVRRMPLNAHDGRKRLQLLPGREEKRA